MVYTNPNDGVTAPSGADAFNPPVQLKATVDSGGIYHNRKIYADSTAMNAETYAVNGWTAFTANDGASYRYNGTSWVVTAKPWTAWTPTLQNFNSLGTGGAATGEFKVESGYCQWWLKISFGSGAASPSTAWGFTPPQTIRPALNTSSHKIGQGIFRDISAGNTAATGNADLVVIYDTELGFAGFRQPYSGTSVITGYGYLSASNGGIPAIGNGDYMTANGQFAL